MRTTFWLVLGFVCASWLVVVGLGGLLTDPATPAGQAFRALGGWTLGVLAVVGLLTGGGFALAGEVARVEAARSTDAAVATGVGLLGGEVVE